jgi:hypothetical protein
MTAFIVIVIAGVWHAKKNSNLADQGIYDDGGEMPYIHPTDEPDPNSREYKIGTLKEAVKSFRNAKTFKATISEDMPEGKMKGELAYMAPLRLQAALTIDNKISFEMIIVGETAYAKMPNDSWKMTNDEVIKNFGRDFLQTLLNKDESLASFGIENESSIEIKENVREDCVEYRAQYALEEEMHNIVLCVDKNGLIKFIKKQHPDGEGLTYYKDYNALFTIERPSLPILDRTPEYIQL